MTNALKDLRNLVPLSQAGFAQEMGVPLRTYEDLEAGRSQVRAVHINAAIWAVIKTAAREDVATIVLPNDIQAVVQAIAARVPVAPAGKRPAMQVTIKNATPMFKIGGINDTEPFIGIEHGDGDDLSMFKKNIRLRFRHGTTEEQARRIKEILEENIVGIDEF